MIINTHISKNNSDSTFSEKPEIATSFDFYRMKILYKKGHWAFQLSEIQSFQFPILLTQVTEWQTKEYHLKKFAKWGNKWQDEQSWYGSDSDR